MGGLRKILFLSLLGAIAVAAAMWDSIALRSAWLETPPSGLATGDPAGGLAAGGDTESARDDLLILEIGGERAVSPVAAHPGSASRRQPPPRRPAAPIASGGRGRPDTPATRPSEAPPAEAIVHIVGPGETLSSISRLYYGSEQRASWIARRNGIEDPDRLATGVKLTLPPPPETAAEHREDHEAKRSPP